MANEADLPTPDDRSLIQSVLKASFATTDEFHHSARSFRNRLVVMSFIALFAIGCMVLLQWRLPSAALLQQPTGTSLSRWALLLLVIVFGALGALLTTIPAIAAIPRVSSPFNFPMQQAFLKICIGSISAVIGVVAIGSAGVTTGLASLESLLGIAVAFGAAQQTVTGYLDKRAKTITDLQG